MVAAIQAASACSSAASSKVTTSAGPPRTATAVRPGTSVAGAMACIAAVTIAGFER